MINLICFLAVATAAVFIYRQGLKDGQKVGNGEKIIDKPIKLTKNKAEKAAEQQKQVIGNAVKSRLEYGVKK